MSPRVLLVGLPGSGKTTSGRRLAKILELPFADSDTLVEAAERATVTSLFAERGEAAFRVAEAAAVIAALNGFDGVLALGGGALTSAETRAAVLGVGVPVALLRATLDTLGVRVGDGRSRPLLALDPAARLAELSRQRATLYAELATFTVDTDTRTPGQVAAAVAARLYERRVRL